MVVCENVFVVAGFMDEKKIGFILFMEDQPIGLRVIADPVTEYLVGPLGLVQGEVEQCLAVICPIPRRCESRRC